MFLWYARCLGYCQLVLWHNTSQFGSLGASLCTSPSSKGHVVCGQTDAVLEWEFVGSLVYGVETILLFCVFIGSFFLSRLDVFSIPRFYDKNASTV